VRGIASGPMRGIAPPGGLWRHTEFVKLWTGQTISRFGSAISPEPAPVRHAGKAGITTMYAVLHVVMGANS
jgi:hypothetical protein